MLINGIVAYCNNKGIGINNELPWNLKEDLKKFKKHTLGKGNNAVIMGKNTWNSIKFLKDRDNLVLSSSITLDENREKNILKSFLTIDDVLKWCNDKKYDEVWVIGGSTIYKQFLDLNLIDNLYITFINKSYKCDTFFPSIPSNYIIIQHQIMPENTSDGSNTFMLIYKRLQINMVIKYNFNKWIIKDIIKYEEFKVRYKLLIQNEVTGEETTTTTTNIKIIS